MTTDTLTGSAPADQEDNDVDWSVQPHQSHPEVVAFEYRQGKTPNYETVLTVGLLMDLITRPDPDHPFHGNRKVDRSRARKFGKYVSTRVLNDDLIVPGLILQVEPIYLEFVGKTPLPSQGSIMGLLTFTGSVRLRRYVDGQHRGLGFHEEVADLAERIRKIQDQIERHQRRNEDVPQSLANERRTLNKKVKEMEHLVVPIQVLATDQKASEMLFVDVNDNSLGVRKDFRATLDQRVSVNRIAANLADTHVLLQNKVENGQSRTITATNPNWLGMETVAKISRYVLRGGSGRFGAVAEQETSDNLATEQAKVEAFFDALGVLSDIQLGIRDVPAMRDTTMLAYQTTIVVLAAAWHKLTTFDGYQPGDQVAFLRWAEPKMAGVPIELTGATPHPYAQFWSDIKGASTRLALAWRDEVGRRVPDHAELYG
jgi:DNA-sulfur modification-associated